MTFYVEHVPVLDPSEWSQQLLSQKGLAPELISQFTAKVEALVSKCDTAKGETIKVIYAARHGQSQHNLLAIEHGGYDEAHAVKPVVDPPLTEEGEIQSMTIGTNLQKARGSGLSMSKQNFTSPLMRCCQTTTNEWGQCAPAGQEFSATVIEGLREHMILHKWNERRPLSPLKTEYPSWVFQTDMTEEDQLMAAQWKTGRDETEEELLARTSVALQQILEMSKGETYISVTSHSGAIRGLQHAANAPRHDLKPGEMAPLVIRVTEKTG